MRVNVYAEEMSDKVEIVSKKIDGKEYTGLRIYLYLPVTLPNGEQAQGPFMHQKDDDDSAAITFWGKKDLRNVLKLALDKLDEHYEPKSAGHSGCCGGGVCDVARDALRELHGGGDF